MSSEAVFKAGAAQVDISPADSQFLFGYPSVARYSTGIHDPLLSSALFLSGGGQSILFIANDVIFIPRETVLSARRKICQQTGIFSMQILISATHTHSAPLTVDHASNADDAVVPKADPAYIRKLEEGIIEAGVQAVSSAVEAEIAFVKADSTGVGTNRRNPAGPALHEVPVVAVRSRKDQKILGVMLVCTMHPTVLHEDSSLVSSDFPGFARQYLQQAFGACPVIYHTGPCGNLSPRHVTRANTFAEAERLGTILGSAVERALKDAQFKPCASLAAERGIVEPAARSFPSVKQAQTALVRAEKRFAEMKQNGTPQAARGAEVDFFGAQETLTLAKLEQSGQLESFRAVRTPAEVQVLRIGPFCFAGWPAEVFVEYGLALKTACADAYIISMANGELQGYIVTEEAAAEGGYEASNALFAPETGKRLLAETLKVIQEKL
jgi:hypothetical protein